MADIFNIKDPVLEVAGFGFREQNKGWNRLPETGYGNIAERLKQLSGNTAGCMIRFRTNSPKIRVQVWLNEVIDMSHMPKSGSSGVDVYAGPYRSSIFIGVGYPQSGKQYYEADFDLAKYNLGAMMDFTVNLPLYDGITDLNIITEPGSKVERPTPFAHDKPVVFYGSSITQGGCASRPGNCHTSILSRRLDARVINLGFSGSALAEPEMADIICSLDMSVLVLEYDHNAHHARYLRETHQPFFRSIRARHPELDIVMASKPDFGNTPEDPDRRRTIMKTYRDAIADGDKHVYFIDGKKLFGTKDRDSCTVDNCHPNDIGFARMAAAMLPTLQKILNRG